MKEITLENLKDHVLQATEEEAHYEYSCDESTCDSICRCGSIVSVSYTVSFQYLIQGLYVESEKLESFLLSRYLWELLNLNRGMDGLFETEINQGYYGEEIGSTTATGYSWEGLLKKVKGFLALSAHAQVNALLELEYGHVLPEIKTGTEWEVRDIHLKDISVNKGVIASISVENCRDYQRMTPWGCSRCLFPPILLLPKSNGGYRLVDGNHRFLAWTTRPVNVTKGKWERMKKNKVIPSIVPKVYEEPVGPTIDGIDLAIKDAFSNIRKEDLTVTYVKGARVVSYESKSEDCVFKLTLITSKKDE